MQSRQLTLDADPVFPARRRPSSSVLTQQNAQGRSRSPVRSSFGEVRVALRGSTQTSAWMPSRVQPRLQASVLHSSVLGQGRVRGEREILPPLRTHIGTERTRQVDSHCVRHMPIIRCSVPIPPPSRDRLCVLFWVAPDFGTGGARSLYRRTFEGNRPRPRARAAPRLRCRT